MSAKQTSESFWSRVSVGNLDECWPWQGSTNSTGYGNAAWHGKLYCAHRVAAWLLGLVEHPAAPIDKDAHGFVLHSCDNRLCCNPTHFFMGNFTSNMLDMYEKKRHVVYYGSSHANAKLTDEDVLAIRARYALGGVRQVDIANDYGVNQVTISLVVRRETYTWI